MTQQADIRIVELASKLAGSQPQTKLNIPVSLLVISKDSYATDIIAPYLARIGNLSVHYCASLADAKDHYDGVILANPALDLNTRQILADATRQYTNVLLISNDMNGDLARIALQLRVRDMIPLGKLDPELLAFLQQLAGEMQASAGLAPVVAVLNGKAGSGASFLACSTAEICAQYSDKQIVLLDGDYNFGALSHMLGIDSKYAICDALDELERLDDTAVQSMLSKRDNLSLMANRPFSRMQMNGLKQIEKLHQLLFKIRRNQQLLVADLSKGIEPVAEPVLAIANKILIVTQLNVSNLRETKAQLQYLREQMGIDKDRLQVVVNRFTRGASDISLDDVEKILSIDSISTISNNYRLASMHSDLGRPLSKLEDNQKLSAELHQLVDDIFPISINPLPKSGNVFRKLLGR